MLNACCRLSDSPVALLPSGSTMAAVRPVRGSPMSARASISAFARLPLCAAALAACVSVCLASRPAPSALRADSPDSLRSFPSASALPWGGSLQARRGEGARWAEAGPLAAIHPNTALLTSGCIGWTTLEAGTNLVRIWGSLVYDSSRERMILFGGAWHGGPFNDVWVQSLLGPPGWARLPTSGDPPPDGWNAAIYDPARDRLVVFRPGVGEVWELSLSGTPTWSRLATSGAPGLGTMFTVAYDSLGDRAIVFGGRNEDNDPATGTWALTLADLAWSPLPDGPADYDSKAFYDPRRDRLLVVGGAMDGSGGPLYALTLSGTPQWSYVGTIGTYPTVRGEYGTAYDPVHDRVFVFGGYRSGAFINDAWQLDLAAATPTWSQVTAANPPPPRSIPYAIYDAPRDRWIVFGGRNLQDTWALPTDAPLAWSRLDDPHRVPSPRAAHSAIWDAPRQRMVVFGGEGWDDPTMSDVRSLDLSGPPTWSLLAITGPEPAGRASHSAILDPARDRMIVFGGREGTNARLLADAWSFSLAGTPAWTQLAPTGPPPGKRSSHTAIHDPVRDRMIVFGGYDSALVYHNDVWALDLATDAWQELHPSGTPPTPRVEHCAVYDPVRDRMLVIAGFDRVTGFLNTVWALSLAGGESWSELTPAGPPPPTRDGSAVYDAARDRVLLYGGSSAAPDVYALELSGEPTWLALPAPAHVPPRGGHSAIFDADHDRMVVFAGGGYENDVKVSLPCRRVGRDAHRRARHGLRLLRVGRRRLREREPSRPEHGRGPQRRRPLRAGHGDAPCPVRRGCAGAWRRAALAVRHARARGAGHDRARGGPVWALGPAVAGCDGGIRRVRGAGRHGGAGTGVLLPADRLAR
ncbi:MAG: hypothetical protein E6K72_00215 [Candidatus Eisenbacteria bacterium]|uniref:Galactose oxidase n=1 Tax=Eiseniibacteriota bacterium TaxID=2212470 RepID=A0A538TBA1_UNCEI|nr:MAG: hypothetical protein E6K72_00215 [Candidatus Eisenbacteria bacterium]